MFSWNILSARLQHLVSNVSWDIHVFCCVVCTCRCFCLCSLCSLIGLWVVDDTCSNSLIIFLFSSCETMLWLCTLFFFPFFMSFALSFSLAWISPQKCLFCWGFRPHQNIGVCVVSVCVMCVTGTFDFRWHDSRRGWQEHQCIYFLPGVVMRRKTTPGINSHLCWYSAENTWKIL